MEVRSGTVYFNAETQQPELRVGGIYYGPAGQQPTSAVLPVRRPNSAIPIVNPQVCVLAGFMGVGFIEKLMHSPYKLNCWVWLFCRYVALVRTFRILYMTVCKALSGL